MSIRANKRFGDFDVYLTIKGKRHKVGRASTMEQAKQILQQAYDKKQQGQGETEQ